MGSVEPTCILGHPFSLAKSTVAPVGQLDPSLLLLSSPIGRRTGQQNLSYTHDTPRRTQLTLSGALKSLWAVQFPVDPAGTSTEVLV